VPRPGGSRRDDGVPVPRPLNVAAAWSWRLMVIGAAVIVAAFALAEVKVVVLPVIGALLLATFLSPPASWMIRHGVPRALAALVMVVSLLAAISGVGYWMALIIRANAPEVGASIRQGARDLEAWISRGPFGLEPNRIDAAFDSARDALFSSEGALVGGVIARATTAAEVVAGILLTIVLVFFFIKDGDRMWAWVVRRLGVDAGAHANATGRRAWGALGGYMRGQAIVAFVDAVFIGMGAFILGVPFALPIALITFLAGFFPIVGAVSAGIVAVLIALATEGFTTALIMLAIVVGVQQLESNALEPVVMARTVRLHPVAVLLALGAGAAIGGIVGAFLAVPVAAAGSAAFGYVWSRVGPDTAPTVPEPAGDAPAEGTEERPKP
jgi:putative heme transporter